MDHLGLVEAVDGLGQSVVVAVAHAADRRLDPSFGEALNPIERLFNKLKNCRRVATRCDKPRESYLGFVALASIKLWIPFVLET
ncbi:MAG: transposase [Sphingosinicella sp.]|nr:transposase [Sphingosinicella sp.]